MRNGFETSFVVNKKHERMRSEGVTEVEQCGRGAFASLICMLMYVDLNLEIYQPAEKSFL